MRKKVLLMCMCICVVVMVACGRKAVSENMEEVIVENDSNKEEDNNNLEVEESLTIDVQEEIEEVVNDDVEESQYPQFFIVGNGFDVPADTRILGVDTPEGFFMYGKSADNINSNDVTGVTFMNSDNQMLTIDVSFADGSVCHLMECLKEFLGTGEYEEYIEQYSSNFITGQEEIPVLLEKKDVVETVFGDIQIIYMIGKDFEVELAYEFAIINTNGCSVYLKCSYGENTGYKGILKESLGYMLSKNKVSADNASHVISYGEYDYIISEAFGYNVPEGYIDDGKGDISGEYETIYVREMDEEGYPELAKFLATGTFEEGNNEYYKVISMEDHGSVDTDYGTARIVYQYSYWDTIDKHEAIEYIVLNANGRDIVVCCYYKEMSEYRGVLEELLPVMTKKRTN
ncbi:MAG: hypothetical protein IKY23_04970 [Lachnospiraceae bacterium]|nr:hypothetical protein [Lachnospiraceae bacterium]